MSLRIWKCSAEPRWPILAQKSIFIASAVSKWLNEPNQENDIKVSFAPSRCKSRIMEDIRKMRVSYTVTSRELVRQVPNKQ